MIFKILQYVKSNYQGIEDYINIYTMDYHYQDFNYSLNDVFDGKINSSIQEYQYYYDLLEKKMVLFLYVAKLFRENVDEYILNYQYLKQFPMIDTGGKKLNINLDTDQCFVLCS